MKVTALKGERDRRCGMMSGWTWVLATGLVVLLTASGRLAAQTEAKPGAEAKGRAEAQAAAGQETGTGQAKPAATQQAPSPDQKKAAGEMVGPVPEDCHSKTPPPTPGTNPEGKAPRLVCDQMKYTVENLWSGQQIECVFNIRNDGDANLEIKAAGG